MQALALRRTAARRTLSAVLIAALVGSALVEAATAQLFARRHRQPAVQCKFTHYLPAGLPAGATAPVVLFLHGAGAHSHGTPASTYRDLYRHLTAQGYVVIVPWYMDGNVTRPHTWFSSAIGGTRAAWRSLERCTAVRPDPSHFAVVGHSLGGLFALRYASLAATRTDLPRPRAIVLHDAAGYSFAPYFSSLLTDIRRWRYTTAPFDRFDAIDDSTLLVALVSEETYQNEAVREPYDGDRITFANANAGGVLSRAWHTTGIENERRQLLLVQSDCSRRVPLVSAHASPESPVNEIDAIYWRVTDAALAAALSAHETVPAWDLSASWADGRRQLVPLVGVPAPCPFAWNCQLILSESRAARWIMPRGACR